MIQARSLLGIRNLDSVFFAFVVAFLAFEDFFFIVVYRCVKVLFLAQFPEGDRRGCRDVEGIHAVLHGDAHHMVG